MTRPATAATVPVITRVTVPPVPETTRLVIQTTEEFGPSTYIIPGESTGTPVVPVTCIYVYTPSTSTPYKPVTTTTVQPPPTSIIYTTSTSTPTTSRVSKYAPNSLIWIRLKPQTNI